MSFKTEFRGFTTFSPTFADEGVGILNHAHDKKVMFWKPSAYDNLISAHEEILAIKRMKLEYEDLVNLSPELSSQWDTILQQVSIQ